MIEPRIFPGLFFINNCSGFLSTIKNTGSIYDYFSDIFKGLLHASPRNFSKWISFGTLTGICSKTTQRVSLCSHRPRRMTPPEITIDIAQEITSGIPSLKL